MTAETWAAGTALNLIFAYVDRVEGRKIFTHGTLSANGVLTAEAEGLFIAVGHERFQQMAEATFGNSKKPS